MRIKKAIHIENLSKDGQTNSVIEER